MKKTKLYTSATAVLAGSAMLATALGASAATAKAQSRPGVTVSSGAPRAQRPANDLNLSVGRGQLINLSAPISDVFVANEDVADVQVRSSTQIYVFAKKPGESSVFATTRSGAVVYSANVRAGTNTNSIDTMLKLAMPEAAIQSTPMNGLVLLTGTVAGPEDSAEAERLVQAFVGDDTKVVSRLRTATPLQVNLQVKIAEVNRTLVKALGVNLLTSDPTSGFNFGISQGRAGALTINPATSTVNFSGLTSTTTIGLAGKFLGLDLGSAIDLAETEGLVTTLAQPNLTALSGETASFLAGGEFPIPISQDLGKITIEYKQYGVSLAFSPTVLADGRISMRVRPEVSELTTEGTIRLNGFEIPGLTTRRTETTVELGSGQAFMIGGLLRNTQSNTIDRAPGLGNVPVLGALFRSTRYRKSETELVIIVTPYLVKPVSASQIVLPTDGFKAATDAGRFLLGQSHSGTSGDKRPVPTEAPPATIVAPSVGASSSPKAGKQAETSQAPAAPGFSGN